MTFMPVDGYFGPISDPTLAREALLQRVAHQALRINDKLLAEREKPRRRKKAAA